MELVFNSLGEFFNSIPRLINYLLKADADGANHRIGI